MSFAIESKDLQDRLGFVARAISARPSRPILANVLLTSNHPRQEVTLTGFDGDGCHITSFSADVSSTGAVAVPAALFKDVVGKLQGELAIDMSDDAIGIRHDGGAYTVRGENADDFPSLPEHPSQTRIEVDAEELRRALAAVAAAMSSNETKQVLCGVHVVGDADALEFAATDGHRLHTCKMAADVAHPFELTIPRRTVLALMGRLGEGSAVLTWSPETIGIELTTEDGSDTIISRLLEAQYPNYRQLIPQQYSNTASVDCKAWGAALQRISVLAALQNNICDVSMTSLGLVMDVTSKEQGNGMEQVPIDWQNGEGLLFSASAAYLADGIKALPGATVELCSNTATTPIVLRQPAQGAVVMVMPVQKRKGA